MKHTRREAWRRNVGSVCEGEMSKKHRNADPEEKAEKRRAQSGCLVGEPAPGLSLPFSSPPLSSAFSRYGPYRAMDTRIHARHQTQYRMEEERWNEAEVERKRRETQRRKRLGMRQHSLSYLPFLFGYPSLPPFLSLYLPHHLILILSLLRSFVNPYASEARLNPRRKDREEEEKAGKSSKKATRDTSSMRSSLSLSLFLFSFKYRFAYVL